MNVAACNPSGADLHYIRERGKAFVLISVAGIETAQ
jgi:hypothetical protein